MVRLGKEASKIRSHAKPPLKLRKISLLDQPERERLQSVASTKSSNRPPAVFLFKSIEIGSYIWLILDWGAGLGGSAGI